MQSLGIASEERIATVLPNGPEMAVAFLGIASVAACCPLNPSYREAEYEFYLDDLGARALLLPKGSPSPARQVAERAWFDGHARAVVIAPQGSWGDRVSAAFGEAWEEFGGEVVGEVTYEPTAVDLSGPVAALLAVDASEERYRALRRIVGSLTD